MREKAKVNSLFSLKVYMVFMFDFYCRYNCQNILIQRGGENVKESRKSRLVYKIYPKHKSKNFVIKTWNIAGIKEESGQFSMYMDVLVNKINDF